MENVIYVERPEPKNRLAEFQAKNGSFKDWKPAQLVAVKTYVSRNGNRVMVTCEKVDDTQKHQALMESLSALQQENPGVKILVNAQGEIANIKEPCTLSELAVIGCSIDRGGMYLD